MSSVSTRNRVGSSESLSALGLANLPATMPQPGRWRKVVKHVMRLVERPQVCSSKFPTRGRWSV